MAKNRSSDDKRKDDAPQEIGEGDRVSARRYNKHTREFVESEAGKGRRFGADDLDADLDSDLDTGLDPDELTEAEQAALERAQEQDPQVSRDYSKPTKSSKDKSSSRQPNRR